MSNDKENAVPNIANQHDFTGRRTELETAKLECELRELNRPWFKRPIVYVNSIVAVTALVGVAGQSLLSSIKAERTLLHSEQAIKEAETATLEKEAAIAESESARAELESIRNSVRVARESLDTARREVAISKQAAERFEKRASFARAEFFRLEGLVNELSLTQADQEVVTDFANQSLKRRVIALVSELLGVPREQIGLGSGFLDDLGADSLDTVELIMAMEEEFNIDIPDEEAEKIRTVQDAVDYVSSQ